MVAELDGWCVDISFDYMVPIVDGDDMVQVVRAMGMGNIASAGARSVLANLEERFPQTKGWGC
jgi:hypothetical protein